MMISTRGRYALRVMIDLAEHGDEDYVPMKDVAERQKISLKYIEKIIPVLKKNKLVNGVSGKGGGYKLTKKPEEYKVGDILRLTEHSLAPVACLSEDFGECSRKYECKTINMWMELDKLINEFFDGYTIFDLINQKNLKI